MPLDRFVIAGASGDLTRRYLMPALATLHEAGRAPEGLRVVGVARDAWDSAEFRRRIAEGLERHGGDVSPESRRALLERLEYRRADVTDPESAGELTGDGGRPSAFYLALPPRIFPHAVRALGRAGLPEGSRVVVEKPFGEDLASARELNRLIHEFLPERSVFRIDHFLHKQTVQNVLGLRFANRVFEPVWSARHIERVEIVWDETLALEGRAGYYDSAGALRDMIQNHLLQLMCLVGMEPPHTMGERDLRDRKVELLRAVRAPTPDDVVRHTARARYTAGRIGHRHVPDYVAEEGVDPARATETFARVELLVDNWRWAGVLFVLRSGKALSADRRTISIRFRPVPHLAFGQSEDAVPNLLRFELGPDRLALDVNINGQGDPFDLEHAELAAELAPQGLPAYARLLLDVLEEDPTLSIRDDEAEESWRIVEPIARAWRRGVSQLLEYPAGSGGPERG